MKSWRAKQSMKKQHTEYRCCGNRNRKIESPLSCLHTHTHTHTAIDFEQDQTNSEKSEDGVEEEGSVSGSHARTFGYERCFKPVKLDERGIDVGRLP